MKPRRFASVLINWVYVALGLIIKKNDVNKRDMLALIEAASPDLEKQGFLAVVCINREYSG
jgi:hypothetical protein